MTWQQTLLIAAVPAAITALALVWQQWLTERRVDRRHKADRNEALADQSHERLFAVHEDGLRLLAEVQTAGSLMEANLKAGNRPTQTLLPAPRDVGDEFAAVLGRILLFGSGESVAAFQNARTYALALVNHLQWLHRTGSAGVSSAKVAEWHTETEEWGHKLARSMGTYMFTARVDCGVENRPIALPGAAGAAGRPQSPAPPAQGSGPGPSGAPGSPEQPARPATQPT